MKTKYYIYILAPILLLASCAKTDFDPVPLDSLLKDPLVTNYTVAELKENFIVDNDRYSNPTGDPVGLFTANLIEADKDLVISGYVTSSDTEGNMYKYFIIQEDKPDGQAMKVSVDVSGLSAEFPLGQEVFIRTNGLYIGKYGDSPQLGSLYVNTGRAPVYGDDGEAIYRTEPGRMPVYMARTHIFSHGMPKPHIIEPKVMTIKEILTAPRDEIEHKLIRIKNANFTGKGYDFNNPVNLKDADKIFAPSTGGIGFPQTREITDGTGGIAIATSEYARFAEKRLPSPSIKGDITVVVSWYKDRTFRDGNYQLTLRSLSDLGEGFDGYLESVDYKRIY